MEQPSLPPPIEIIDIYVDDHNTPARARKDVCVRLSAWIEAKLRSEKYIHLEGLDSKVCNALIAYFKLNSTLIRSLNKKDRELLIDIFGLHELKQEYETQAKADEEDALHHAEETTNAT